MKKITAEELVDYRIFPFNIYNAEGEVVVTAGDTLTPGKLLQLRYINELYCDSEDSVEEQEEETNVQEQKKLTQDENYSKNKHLEDLLLEDNLVNPNFPMDMVTQLQLKSSYSKAFNTINNEITSNSIKEINLIRDNILDNLHTIIEKTRKKSQLKMIGNYRQLHGLNVALLSAMLATKLNYSNTKIADITLAALLHDIGKTRLPKVFQTTHGKSSFSKKNPLYEMHPELGYKILKNELHLSQDICAVALEHHENSNGTGYPHKISDEEIHPYSKIVSICNFYDNLISGQTQFLVSTPQEATKVILELGTKHFSSSVLYAFVYMTNYHDDTSLEKFSETGNSNW